MSRLIRVCAKVVDLYQYTFISNYKVANCVIKLNIVINKIILNKELEIAFSPDIERTYNRVYHEWLFKLLE